MRCQLAKMVLQVVKREVEKLINMRACWRHQSNQQSLLTVIKAYNDYS